MKKRIFRMMENTILYFIIILVLTILFGTILAYILRPKKTTTTPRRPGKKFPSSPRPISDEGSKIKKIYKIQAKDSIVISFNSQAHGLENIDTIYQISNTLSSIANYYILCQATSDTEEERIHTQLQSVSASFMPKGRILFYETEIGKIALVRQINPKLYLDFNENTCLSLKPYVTNILSYPSESQIIEKLLESSNL